MSFEIDRTSLLVRVPGAATLASIERALAGEGLTLGIAEALASGIPWIGGTWKDVFAFALLILVLVFRPQGLMGARVVDRA